jgi:MFS family permease
MGYASDFTQLYWLRALMGVSEALYIPSALSLIADWHEGKSRSLAIGIHMTGLYVGQAVGGFGATIAATFSWHSTFYWFGIIGIAYSVVLALLLHDKPKTVAAVAASPNPATLMKKDSLWRGLSVVLSTWAFWVILIYFAVPSLPGWATKNWLPTLFAENLGLDMAEAGPMSTITITASSFGIARLFTAARYRSGGCLHLLSGDTLYDQWQKIFRHRISERCRRMGVALGMLQRKCIAQTDYDDRQLHRYGNRLRGVHGFSLLSFDEAPRPTTHRRNSIKLGRQSSESASVSRTPFDDSCFLRQ